MMPNRLRRVVVAVDGSPDSEGAVGWAILIGLAFHTEVTAVHAVGLVTRINGGLTVPTQGHLDHIRASFEDDWCRPLRDSGVTYRSELIRGDPVDVLRLAARRLDADLLIVGQRGLGRVQTLRLGSTSQALTEHVTLPVLIVPTPASQPANS